VPQHGEAVVVRVIVMPLVSVWVDEKDVVGEVVVVVDYKAVSPVSIKSEHTFQEPTYLKYTIDSRPLFVGTVSGAVWSSTA
jgi:hypothetical protein